MFLNDLCLEVINTNCSNTTPGLLVKTAYQKNIFLISQPKHMLWVLKEPSQ